MGEVYVAEDTRLGRRVALKTLPQGTARDPGRRARFEREARAIAALNHPNIVTIHSVEESEGVHFITMELVEGRTLRELISRERVPVPQILEWAIPIADALSAAHRAGVVHRDLKPDNVMVTNEGRLKVLDFGLAKLHEPVDPEESQTQLPTAPVTQEGMVVGTVAYMSPEQAEGKPLDHRSDIFSFGIVVYEMAAGRRPFHGETSISTITAILRDTPPPVTEGRDDLPHHLGRIVRRCLAKDPARRYQSTDDLRNEFEGLREELISGDWKPARSVPARLPPRRRTTVWVAGMALLLGVGAVGVWIALRGASRVAGRAEAPGDARVQISRVTTHGRARDATIAPDGRYLAYTRQDGETNGLWVRQVATGEEVQIVAPVEARWIRDPVFSPDGDFVLYVRYEEGRPHPDVYRVATLGGAPRLVSEKATGVAIAPDGARLLLREEAPDQTSAAIQVARADGSDRRDLIRHSGGDHFDSGPIWSPDGRSFAVVSHVYGETPQIAILDVDGAKKRSLIAAGLESLGALGWTTGDEMIAVGTDRPGVGGRQLWRVDTTTGRTVPLTSDLNGYSGVSATADGATIVTVVYESRSRVDAASLRDGMPQEFSEVSPLSIAGDGLRGILWTQDNQLLLESRRDGNAQIWIINPAGGRARQITTGPDPYFSPTLTTDGRRIVAASQRKGKYQLWRIEVESGRAEPLTTGVSDWSPLITPDGRSVVYSSLRDAKRRLLKIPIEGGEPVPVAVPTERPLDCVAIAPDGRQLLCVDRSEAKPTTLLVPLAGGEPKLVEGLPSRAQTQGFSTDGESIVYSLSENDLENLWSLPLDGGPAKKLVGFEDRDLDISGVAWSPDGSRLAVVRVSYSGDVVLLHRAVRPR